MASKPGFEPRPHWWEASALTTAPSISKCRGIILKKDLQSLYFRNIKTTYSDKQILRSICSGPIDWRTIYSIPFDCAIDTKSREFQQKILNRILPFNDFLFKIGKCVSSLYGLSLNRRKHASFVFSLVACTKFLEFNSTIFWS